jgi:hypothetical protein
VKNKKIKILLPKVQFARQVHHFSVKQMLMFVLVFGGLGAYFLWHSFAAQPLVLTIETENMPVPTGAEKIADATASAGWYMRFNNAVSTNTTFTLPSQVTTVTIRAKGVQCKGSPTLVVNLLKADGTADPIANQVVSATTWTTYSFSKNIPAGANTLSVGFANDKNRGCDRQLAVDAVLFYGPDDAVDTLLSQGKSVLASSTSTSAGPASYVTDGNTASRWSSAYADPQWIRIDLGVTMNVSRVKLIWEAAYGRAYQLQISDDGTTWRDLYSTTTGDGSIDEITGLNSNGRYVRMNGTTRATQWGYSLWEMQVYGSSAANPDTQTPTVSLISTPATVTTGQSATLTWSSSNATSCSAPWLSVNATNGSVTVSPSSTTTYSITCAGSGGTSTATTNITVNSPPTGNGSIYWGANIEGEETYDVIYGPAGTWHDAPWDSNSWNRFESNAGKKVSLLYMGTNGAPWNSDKTYRPMSNYRGGMDLIVGRGDIVYLDMDTRSYSLADIANGVYDASIRSWGTDARNWQGGKPFLFRWNREMNGSWFSWGQQARANPAVFVAAWRHFHDVVTAAGATNVTWAWCPNRLPETSSSGYSSAASLMSSLYPGDAYVDWTCTDGYNQSTSTADWKNFNSIYKSTYDHLLTIAPNKPIMIGEISSREVGGSKADWIKDMLATQLPVNFPQIKAFSWFNYLFPESGAVQPYPIESSTGSQAAFKAGIASPYYAPGGSYGNLPVLTKVQPLP